MTIKATSSLHKLGLCGDWIYNRSMRIGRPTKYSQRYPLILMGLFSDKPYRIESGKKIPNELPLISDFARHIGVNRSTVFRWSKKYPEFCNAIKEAKDVQEKFLITNGLMGLYDSGFAILMAKRLLGWRNKEIRFGKYASGPPAKIERI